MTRIRKKSAGMPPSQLLLTAARILLRWGAPPPSSEPAVVYCPAASDTHDPGAVVEHEYMTGYCYAGSSHDLVAFAPPGRKGAQILLPTSSQYEQPRRQEPTPFEPTSLFRPSIPRRRTVTHPSWWRQVTDGAGQAGGPPHGLDHSVQSPVAGSIGRQILPLAWIW